MKKNKEMWPRGQRKRANIYGRYVYISLDTRACARVRKFKRVTKLFKVIANFVNLTRIRYANHILRVHIEPIKKKKIAFLDIFNYKFVPR